MFLVSKFTVRFKKKLANSSLCVCVCVSRVGLFPQVKSVLEFGACVASVESLLVNGVVCVEPDHDGISSRVNLLRRLKQNTSTGHL